MYRETMRERLSAWLEKHTPTDELWLRPPVEAIEEVAAPLRPLYAVADGQEGDSSLFDTHRFLTITEARSVKAMMDQLKKDDGWEEAWWSEAWHPFASDGMGQHLVVDERDDSVIEFAHDDEARPVLAPSAEKFLEQFVESLEGGLRVFDNTIGIIETAVLERGRAERVEREARELAAKADARRVSLGAIAASAVLAIVLILLDIWLRD